MKSATITADEVDAEAGLFRNHCYIGFLTRFSYALARNPVLPLFAAALGAGPQGIGLAVGAVEGAATGSPRR